jgi:hypothetical protein
MKLDAESVGAPVRRAEKPVVAVPGCFVAGVRAVPVQLRAMSKGSYEPRLSHDGGEEELAVDEKSLPVGRLSR